MEEKSIVSAPDAIVLWGTSMLNPEHNANHQYNTKDLGVESPLVNRRISLIAHILLCDQVKTVVVFCGTSL